MGTVDQDPNTDTCQSNLGKLLEVLFLGIAKKLKQLAMFLLK